MKKHQEENPLTAPFQAAKRWIVSLFKEKKQGKPLTERTQMAIVHKKTSRTL
jgi:hypothetical protein